MKKFYFIVIMFCMTTMLMSQNIQILGSRNQGSYINYATFELFKPLDHGKLYYFTDLNMNQNGYYNSYTELSKYWNITKDGVSITGQINTGMFILEGYGIQINPVYLVGLSKEVEAGEWILSLDILYRNDQTRLLGDMYLGPKIGSGIQLTGTFLKDTKNFQISGYCDLWQTNYSEVYNKNNNSLIVMFEPQLWWKMTNRIYLGFETRLSNMNSFDFGLAEYAKYCMFGLKWNLE